MAALELLIDLLSWAALLAGAFFYTVGAIGMVRMPDVFTRMHAVSISETLGTGLLILGMVLQAGISLVAVKLVIIFLVLMVVSPVSSHALARAALHDGLRPLLANSKGWLVKTDCVTLFPELGVRLSQPLSSEQVEGDEPEPRRQSDREGYAYDLDGDTVVPVARERGDGPAGGGRD